MTLRTFSKWLMVVVMLVALSGCIPPPNVKIPQYPPKPRRVASSPDVALVLGGGGARGYAHLGALHELQQAGIPVNLVVGSSAGALVGALFADRGHVQDAECALMKAGFFDFADIELTSSLRAPITGKALQWFLIRHMKSQEFKATQIPLAVMATDLNTGLPYEISSGPIPPAITASAALPGATRPIRMYGKTLIDGSMVAPIPVKTALKYQPKVVIAIDICSDLAPSLPTNAYGVYYRAYQISWNALAKKSCQGADVVIHPYVGAGGTFSISEKHRYYQAGVRAARRMLPRIKALLVSRGIALQAPTLAKKSPKTTVPSHV